MEKERKSSKLLEENTEAKPHLLPKAGQLGKEKRWDRPGGKNEGISVGSGRKFLSTLSLKPQD